MYDFDVVTGPASAHLLPPDAEPEPIQASGDRGVADAAPPDRAIVVTEAKQPAA